MGIGALGDKTGQELGQRTGVWPGKSLLRLAVVEEHLRRELLAAVQERWDRSQRHNGSGQHRLTQERVQQGALAALELAENGQVAAIFAQPLPQGVQSAAVGLELRTERADLRAGCLQKVGQRVAVRAIGRRPHIGDKGWPAQSGFRRASRRCARL